MTAIDPHRCCPREARARRVARWWLAGLLVGCLLPASLSAAESPRATERLVQICIMAPAVIRAHTMLKACRHRLARHPLKTLPKPSSPSVAWSAPMLVPVAALDVVSRRGPPDIA
ncbi:hypothetical protein NFH98_07605 [Halomonas sp. H33-56]|uniref:Uncharacterized protein n=2 Tax=unclassified Halomonas TaxID=2609666 RepID=A0AAU7KLJ4_9GAMM|nr:hypothetical protein [Halomonas sp. DP5N14-9]MBR9769668.1 hypothetical protein [Gammaproteobacteria bacterium]MBY5941971.1 hypothetical protein [Halomonas sp. DP5N14-9]